MKTMLPVRPGSQPGLSPHRRMRIAVEVLVCGSPDRGDDGAPLAIVERLRDSLPSDVSVRTVGQLDIDHLLWIREGAGVVVVDAATGIGAGAVVTLPLDGLIDGHDPIHPRSSHALAIPEVVGLADMIRGRPLVGRIVAIGGAHFDLGRPISKAVATSLDALVGAVLDTVDQVRPVHDRAPGSL